VRRVEVRLLRERGAEERLRVGLVEAEREGLGAGERRRKEDAVVAERVRRRFDAAAEDLQDAVVQRGELQRGDGTWSASIQAAAQVEI